MNRHEQLMDQAVEAYAAREFPRAIELCDAILKKDPDHPRAHSFKALSNLDAAVRSLRGHFDALSLAAVALRGEEELPEPEKKRHLKTAKRTYKSLSKQVEQFFKSLSHALKKDPSLHRDFPPQTAEDYRHHWQEGLSKALRAAADVIVKIEPEQEEKLHARLEELNERFEGLLHRIESPPDALPDGDYGELTGDGAFFEALGGEEEDGFPRFDLGEMQTMSLADDEGKLELMSLAENTEAGQMLVTDASGMIVEFDDTAGPVGRLEFPGAPPAEEEPDPEAEQKKLAELEQERRAQLEQMQQMASQAANQAAEQMQGQLEQARKQADEERKRFESSLAEAQKALAAAEKRLADQAKQEEARRQQDVAKAQEEGAEEARKRLKELERENEEAKRRLAEAERKKETQGTPEEIAAQVAERVAMQMIERFQEQMQHQPEEMPHVPTPKEVAQEVAQLLGSQMGATKGDKKTDKRAAKIAASAAEQASREIHEQVTMLTNASMTGLTTSPGAGVTKTSTSTQGGKSKSTGKRSGQKPELPSLDGGINQALGRKKGDASPATKEKTRDKQKTPGKESAQEKTKSKSTSGKGKARGTKDRSRKAPSPETLLGVKETSKKGGQRTGVTKQAPSPREESALSFQDREEVVPLETPEGKGLINELSGAYREWVQGLKAHPWPQAGEALFPMSLHRGRLYTFQLQAIFETRVLKPGEAEFQREMLPAKPLSAREIDPWSLGVDLPLKAVSQHAVYRLPESYERRGNRLSFLELRVERVPRVEMFLYPADSLPPKANLLEALRGASILATEQFEPFLDPPATRRLFPKPLHGLVRGLASDLQRQETATTKLRSLTVVVAEVPLARLRYRLPGAPDYLSEISVKTPKASTLEEITNEDPQLGRIYECCFFAQPGETQMQRRWHVAPRADVALEHAASLHSDAVWSASRGQQNRTMRLTQQLLRLDPGDAEAAALQRKVRQQARFDYRMGFVLGMLACFLLALLALQTAPAMTLALAPLYVLAGGLTSFVLWHGAGVLLGSRSLRWILGTVLVTAVTLASPWLLAQAAPYPWLELTELYPALQEAALPWV